jgi:uncharacterized membrane protein YtjA (UPF0391 family)
MTNWPLAFLIAALLAALLGFAGVGGATAWIARALLVLFLALFAACRLSGQKRTVSHKILPKQPAWRSEDTEH